MTARDLPSLCDGRMDGKESGILLVHNCFSLTFELKIFNELSPKFRAFVYSVFVNESFRRRLKLSPYTQYLCQRAFRRRSSSCFSRYITTIGFRGCTERYIHRYAHSLAVSCLGYRLSFGHRLGVESPAFSDTLDLARQPTPPRAQNQRLALAREQKQKLLKKTWLKTSSFFLGWAPNPVCPNLTILYRAARLYPHTANRSCTSNAREIRAELAKKESQQASVPRIFIFQEGRQHLRTAPVFSCPTYICTYIYFFFPPLDYSSPAPSSTTAR